MMIKLNADTKDLSSFLDTLSSDLSRAPHKVRKLALDFLNFSAELVCFEFRATSGTALTVLLKPSQRLLDLGLAVRTGNLDLLVVKYPHKQTSKEDIIKLFESYDFKDSLGHRLTNCQDFHDLLKRIFT